MAAELAEHAVDHPPRAERLAAAHAMEWLGFVQRHGLLRLRAEQEPRHQLDRVLRAGLGAQAALQAVALDEAQPRRVGGVEQRAFRAGADAGLAQRAGLLVDGQGAERRAGGKLDFLDLPGSIHGQMIELEIERGALLGREVEGGGLRYPHRGFQRPKLFLERVSVEKEEMRTLKTQGIEDDFAQRHLLAQRRRVVLRFLRRYHHDLACAIADGAEQRVEADRGDMEHFKGDGARRKALAAPHCLAADGLYLPAAALGVVEYEAGVGAACLAIGREQRLQSHADVRNSRIRIGHRTGWTDARDDRSEEHTSELQSHHDLVCRLLLEKKKKSKITKNQ